MFSWFVVVPRTILSFRWFVVVPRTILNKRDCISKPLILFFYNMPIPKMHKIPGAVYFLTCVIVNKLDIFTYKEFFDIVVESLAYCIKEKGLKLHGFVIMPNHLHLIASHDNALSDVIRDFKRFTARQIIEQLNKFNRQYILNLLKFAGKSKNKQNHQVWIHRNYPESVQNIEFFLQKLNYIHNNPVKRGFVSLPEDWIYSSAKCYVSGEDGVLEIEKFC